MRRVRPRRRLVPAAVAALLACAALDGGAPAVAHAAGVRSFDDGGAGNGAATRAALDVPYVPQTPDLCGGAAAAMVLRYWGERGVAAEDFAPLVRSERAGIPTGILTNAVQQRGWTALPFTGTPQIVSHHLSRGRPVIALIAAGTGRFHYVVVLAWAADHVVVHDPARTPSMRMRTEEFLDAWGSSGRWTLLVLPADDGVRGTTTAADAGTHPSAATASSVPDVPAACAPLLQRGIERAGAGDQSGAESALLEARDACPHSSIPWRELAGLELLRSNHHAATALATRAVALDPDDTHAWRVLATGRFLLRDRRGALSAWNRLAEPRVDLVRVDGLARTRFRVVDAAIGAQPGRILTPDRLSHAERRIAALPGISASRVAYRPVPGGLAEVQAVVLERPLVPASRMVLAAMSVRALVNREVTMPIANPTGSGELWTIGGRFWERRPSVFGSLATPLHIGPIGGVLTLGGGWEEQSYGVPGVRTFSEETRRSIHASLGDWASAQVRWDAGMGVDRWESIGRHVWLGGALETRLGDDHLALRLAGRGWSGERGFATGSASAAWRSTTEPAAGSWHLAATLQSATDRSPLDLWSGAGTGQGRSLLLRAHPLLDEGVVRGAVFGRQVVHVTVERRQPVASVGPLQLAIAGFVDAARHRAGMIAGAGQVDAGLGLRVRVPGEGVLRVDIARGLADGASALSAGWQVPWPAW